MKKYLSFGLSLFVLGFMIVGTASNASAANISIFVVAGAGGSISPAGVIGPDFPSTPVVSVAQGSSQTFTITPNAGASVLDVLVDGLSVGAVTSYTFNLPVTSKNHSIEASFTEPEMIVVKTVAGAGGSISPAGPISVPRGSDQTLNIIPDAGYHVLDVVVTFGGNTHLGGVKSYTFTNLQHNQTITASFEADLPPSGGGGGSTGGGQIIPPTTPATEGKVLGAQTFQFTKTLRLGMKGDDVLELHKKLTDLGFYKGPIDNKFGLLLQAAVKAFQKANPPLKMDGVVGAKTRTVLNTANK